MTGIQVYECDDWAEAVAEAIRLTEVSLTKFGPEGTRYVVRKRRSSWPHDSRRRLWGTGQDRWRVLTSANVPDRDPSRPVPWYSGVYAHSREALADLLAQHGLEVPTPLPREIG